MLLMLLGRSLLPRRGRRGGGSDGLAGGGKSSLQDGLCLSQGLVAIGVPVAAQVEGVEAALDQQDAEERLGQREEHFAFVGLTQLLD